ncbi:IS66 family insertion sequence element accessory protein TnpB, partial [Pseudomonas viridiflava]|uniref:IS66 family insertion sequence element accessory protein TnpB n=1 Tax=Pseudomonas viridiflava TaxID=33069 RepID=UPI0013D9573D
SIWLATEPIDMRAGTATAWTRVIAVFGAAKPRCAYLFANRRATRMKVLVHDGFGIWLAARRLNQGKFHWPGIRHGFAMVLKWNWIPSNLRHWCLHNVSIDRVLTKMVVFSLPESIART